MKTRYYLISLLSLALTACSENEGNPTSTPNPSNTVQFSAQIAGGASTTLLKSSTRFINPGALTGLAFSAGDKFVIGIQNNTNGPTNFSEETCMRTITVGDGPTYTPNAPLYWDDLGGRGTDAFIWGVYMHGTSTPEVTKTGAFNWTVVSDQTGVENFQTLDLLYSNNKTHLVYTPDPSKPTTRDVANMYFNHAMSRILIHVKIGEGFQVSEFENATATLDKQYTGVDVNLLATDTFKTVGNQSDIKMKLAYTPTAATVASFDAIVAPGKKYAVGNLIATLVVNNNTYQLKANQAFVDALHKMSEQNDLLKGKYYVFNVTLGKQAITFTSTITDWISGYETPAGEVEESQIVIDSDDKGASLDGTNRPNNFYLYQSSDGDNFDADSTKKNVQPSTSCTYDEKNNTWTYDPAIYWNGKDDKEDFRGFYPGADPAADKDSLFNDQNSSPLKAGENDYQWGTSDGMVDPTSGKVKMQFDHVMSNIIINLKTVTGNEAVNLVGAKVELTNTIKEGAIDLKTGDITLGTTREDYEVGFKSANSGVFTYHTYALPQTLNGSDGVADNKNFETSNDAFVKITVNEGTKEENTYYFKLNTAKEGSSIIDTWLKNKTYIYNIVLKKKEIEFDAKISDWIKAYESDDILIHL